MSVRQGVTAVAPAQDPAGCHDSPNAEQLHAIAFACAREFSRDYNDQQDLASQGLLAALQYKGDIFFPRQFMRLTIRNLAINHAKSVGAREIPACDREDLWASHGQSESDPCDRLILSDTLGRMECALTPAERRCYELLRTGYEQRDLPRLLNVSRQAVSQLLQSIRRKYLAAEHAESHGLPAGSAGDEVHNQVSGL